MVRRQAVLLIHGIGEQRPMDTLRGFVDAVWRTDVAVHHEFATAVAGALVWSKPDTVSDSFELRRLTTPQNSAGIRTDFFEFYWQHLMQGTTYGHVVAWAMTLLLRKPGTVPAQLKAPYWILWILSIAGVGFAIYAAAGAASDSDPIVAPLLSAIISVAVLPLAAFIIKSIIGDAARYLHVAPPNIQCRHAIRQAGVKLLRTLHERKYDRIIIVGHSLGSVIAYDILTHAWPLYHRQAPASRTGPMDKLDALEQLAASGSAADTVTIQAAQRAYFNELKTNASEWRVTDLITLGSPLSHAAVLLASDAEKLTQRQGDREFPTCLPTLEILIRGGAPLPCFSFKLTDKPDSYRVPHHAAVFAPTRWTNLFFPSRTLLWGDLIGGPLAPVLGAAIRDVELQTSERGGLLSHTLYWSIPKASGTPPHIRKLRDVLDLTDSRS